MDPPQKSSGVKLRFWRKTPNKTPGSIKQVRGAQYPPIMNKNNPYKMSSGTKNHKKRHSTSITLKAATMSDSHLNYKATVNPPLSNNKYYHNQSPNNKVSVNHINDDNILDINTPNIDINDLIQSAKLEREQQLKLDKLNNDQNDNKNKKKLNNNKNGHNIIKNGSKNKKNNIKANKNINTNIDNDNDNQDDNDKKDDKDNDNDKKDNSNKNVSIVLKDWTEIKNDNEAFARKNRNRINLLTKMLSQTVLNSSSLRRACWRGIPSSMRPSIWKLLLGYIPKNLSRRTITLNKKRNEYYDLIGRYYNADHRYTRSDQENKIVHQIGLDVPRTSPELKLFQITYIKNILSRALYIWSLRHTATGYVQGINDLITPFVYIFIDEYLLTKFNGSISLINMKSRDIIRNGLIPSAELLRIEADSYWCLDYLIEGLQLNYTDNQPGIYCMVEQLRDVVKRVNINLYNHFLSQKLEFIQFSFRWMNCLLMRELSLNNIIRLWDTYLCEGVELSSGFSEFHVFVCAALLLSFADVLIEKDFAEIMLFLQGLPSVTAKWGERQIETILSEAYVYQQLFGKHKKALY